jgi:hypothetical protein
MVKSPPKKSESDHPEGDPKRGDAILKRMLQTKPKHHKDVVAERKAKRPQKK